MGVGIVQFENGRHRVTSRKGIAFIFFNDLATSSGGFCTASSFLSLFAFSFSVWVQSTGAFCGLVRVVCQASEFRRESLNTRNCVYSFRSPFYCFPILHFLTFPSLYCFYPSFLTYTG